MPESWGVHLPLLMHHVINMSNSLLRPTIMFALAKVLGVMPNINMDSKGREIETRRVGLRLRWFLANHWVLGNFCTFAPSGNHEHHHAAELNCDPVAMLPAFLLWSDLLLECFRMIRVVQWIFHTLGSNQFCFLLPIPTTKYLDCQAKEN